MNRIPDQEPTGEGTPEWPEYYIQAVKDGYFAHTKQTFPGGGCIRTRSAKQPTPEEAVAQLELDCISAPSKWGTIPRCLAEQLDRERRFSQN